MTRVLITGASGLLGRAAFQEFINSGQWDVMGLAFSRAGEKYAKVDLTNDFEVAEVISKFKPKVVVHCAAERRPDVVEKEGDKTRALNVSATSAICKYSGEAGASVIYLSTDYVFDGCSPPYKVHDQPNPLNKYGQSKLEGEKVVMAASTDNIILRVPILYGQIESCDESAVTVLFPKVKDSGCECKMDDFLSRYPTHCNDVASVLRQLADRKVQDPSLNGIFHWSSGEKLTKFDMAVKMAEVFRLPSSHISPDKNLPAGAPRPVDANLDTSRLDDLGIGRRIPFVEGIKAALQPFINV